MPLYRVVCDGTDILNYMSQDLVLLAPTLEMAINTTGSLEFVLPPYHKYYDIVNILTSTIEVYEDNDMIWFGRPVEQRIDFYKQKKIYCEGPLSFFNDTVQRPIEYDSVSLEQFFRDVISNHNSQVDNPNRTFQVGNYDLGDRSVYRKLNYNSSYDALTSMCLNAEDGYFFFRRENGINYIDWLTEMPYTCNQPIQFGINLLNYSSNFDATDFATCVLPIGANDSETKEALTIASINNGDDVLRSEAASTYGTIIKAESWSDIKDVYELMAEGQKYLENTQFNALVIECSAADLHSKNADYELFKLGQNVHCVSNPHLIDRYFPLSKISLQLDSAAKIITLGIMKRKTLTRIYKNDVDQMQSYIPEDYTPDSYNPDSSVIEDENGDEWEVIFPDKDGDPITAQRMPTSIRVARMPNKINYQDGENIVWSGLVVQAMVNDEIWKNPPKYISGQIPLGELSFSSNKVHVMPTVMSMEYTVVITWKYKGKEYKTSLKLNVEKQKYEGRIREISVLAYDYTTKYYSDDPKNGRMYLTQGTNPHIGWSFWPYEDQSGSFYDSPQTLCFVKYQNTIYMAMDINIDSADLPGNPPGIALIEDKPVFPGHSHSDREWSTSVYTVYGYGSRNIFNNKFEGFSMSDPNRDWSWLQDSPEINFDPSNKTVAEVWALINE